jgi:phospholipid/cholesterol/gamma-HCH transport system substrate-binding protein
MKSSRSKSWAELKTGLVIIIAFILLAVGILQVGGRTSFFTKRYTLFVRLENSFGLKVGSNVRLAGIEVGNVEDILLPSNPSDKQIIIKLKVQKKYMDRIRQDSFVTIRTMGLLGDKYLDISVGSPQYAVLPPGSVLNNVQGTQLSSVIAGAASGLEGVNAVLGQLKLTLGDVNNGKGTFGMMLKDPRLYDQLAKASENLQNLTQELGKGNGSFGKLVRDPEFYNNLVEVSAKTKELMNKLDTGSFARLSDDKAFYENLRDVSVNLKDITQSTKALADNLNKGSISRISSDPELYNRVERVSARLDSLIAKVESGQGSAGKLLTDEKLYNNMNKFFTDADTLVLDFKKNPGRYIKLSIF